MGYRISRDYGLFGAELLKVEKYNLISLFMLVTLPMTYIFGLLHSFSLKLLSEQKTFSEVLLGIQDLGLGRKCQCQNRDKYLIEDHICLGGKSSFLISLLLFPFFFVETRF